MKIERASHKYDPEADALYVRVRMGRVDRSNVLDDGQIIDLDSEGHLLGIEVLGASRGVQLADLIEPYDLHTFAASLLEIEQTSFRPAART
jgi:uncharacterized protein YuzE